MKQQSIIVVTILISVFLLFSTLTSLYSLSPTTFGYMQVGQNTDLLIPGYKDSCRYQASESGTINSISMYIQTANAQVRFGVYSDQNGKPNQLLAQSNQVTTAGNQWVVASLTASIVAGQYYWLTVTTNAPIRYYIDYASGGSSGYAIEPTTIMSTNYGTFTAYTAVKYSMYATYAAASLPTPSPTVTATPTPRPAIVPTPSPTVTATPTPRPAIVPTPSPTVTATPTPRPTTAPTVIPTLTTDNVNGIWMLPGVSASDCAKLGSMDIKNIYYQIGEWRSDGSIRNLLYPAYETQITAAVTAAHNSGIKIYAWVIAHSSSSMGDPADMSTPVKRQTMINSMINLVQRYGFDGVADDIEGMNPFSFPDLITYYNTATIALNAIGKEYYTAIISYWLYGGMSSAQVASIHVDRIQPMLYCFDYFYPNTDHVSTFKAIIDKLLRDTTSPVGLAIQSIGPPYYDTFASELAWIEQQLPLSPTTHLAGIDNFWYNSMDSSMWDMWSGWSYKN